MNLRTYLMIKQANQALRVPGPYTKSKPYNPGEHHGLLNYPVDEFKQVYKDNGGNLDPAFLDALQAEFAPKGVVPVGDNTFTFGKKPVKALPGIGPMPAGLDYGK